MKNVIVKLVVSAGLIFTSVSASAFQLYINEWKNHTYGVYYVSKTEGAHGDGISFHGANCENGWKETFNHTSAIKFCGKGFMESKGFAVPWYNATAASDTFLKVSHKSKAFRLAIVDCSPNGVQHRCLRVSKGWGSHDVVGSPVALVRGGELNTPCEMSMKLNIESDHSISFDIISDSTGVCTEASDTVKHLGDLTAAIAVAYAGS
tara:strand:- start:229674 stop:230291 length:618 start_codon:yes stop_codon:yes gene_type:complete